MLLEKGIIQDILMAIQLTHDFLGVMSRDEFLFDQKTQSAVIHQLLIIGEAAGRLPDPYTKKHSHIPWAQIRGMRNRLIHGYHEVDLDEVWQTAQNDLSMLRAKIEPLLLDDTPL